MTLTAPPLLRRLAAEAVGTAALAAVVVGSGIRAGALSRDAGVQLLANVTASALALVVLISVLGPVSGGHFNPLVSAAAWWTERRTGTGLTVRELGGYAGAQLAGAVTGTGLANVMFERPFLEVSARARDGVHLWLAEVLATGVLILLVFGLVRSGRGGFVPAAVGLWIAAACWATSSGAFANPAVTVARMFTGSGTGIAAGSVPPFVLAQLVGAVAGVALLPVLFGRPVRPAAVPDDARELIAG
ncbi:aquaporin [Kitasatospora sp. NBC_00240]|uniref:aquaporin n=1 Tax=Kitasatospora sp. NBC_00240 TaxID=2903567 RepID=UPI002257C542|nr:aquaporin [Kitasatospora sp. NBC_00240]MCX5211883.1 aquaporin [Kitasatospora sp. NBC_00240]